MRALEFCTHDIGHGTAHGERTDGECLTDSDGSVVTAQAERARAIHDRLRGVLLCVAGVDTVCLGGECLVPERSATGAAVRSVAIDARITVWSLYSSATAAKIVRAQNVCVGNCGLGYGCRNEEQYG